jgi:16S rRNA (uracil1498-N3)-methyltransferase
MRLTRVYVATPLAAPGEALLEGAAAAHVTRVLRLAPGAPLILFDGRGAEYAGAIVEVAKQRVRVRLDARHAPERDSPLALTLLQCLTRGEKMDLIVQKATELGVARLLPIAAARSLVPLQAALGARRLEHWIAIAAGACEQCGRNTLPLIEAAQTLPQALATLAHGTLRLVLDPQAAQSMSECLGAPASAIAVLIGPEGGLTEEERAQALRAGFRACRFGPRTLRAETAAIAVLAALQAIAGDLR